MARAYRPDAPSHEMASAFAAHLGQDRWLTADWKDAPLLVPAFAGALTEAN